MTDVHDKATRSYNMSCISSKNTKPELQIRSFLFAQGFRYKLHDKSLPGKPDIVLPKFKTVIFVNGCFWHGHENCRFFRIPATRTEWWRVKINGNINNDTKNHMLLREFGYKVLVVWECEIKNKSIFERIVNEIRN